MKETPTLSTAEAVRCVYVQESVTLEMLVRHIGTVDWVALDTEADSLHSYFAKVCLIQLSFADEHYLLDPLCGLDLSKFLNVLAGKSIIVHGGDYDLRMLRASLGFRARREVFDTMIAAQLLGFEQIGLAALIERYFDITIGKAGQKSDWSRRPLSEDQLRYAIGDTRFLEELADLMRAELEARGRLDWHRESCRAMTESAERDSARDPEDAWRIKGAGRLTRRQLAYLRDLWRWRDQHARERNLPAFRILGNPEMLALAQWAEAHPSESLGKGAKLPRNIIGRQLTTLAEAIARVKTMDEKEWPELRKRDSELPHSDCVEMTHALRAECAHIAKQLELSASTLAPKAALEAITRNRPRTIEEIMKTGGLLRWQAELVQPAVEKWLHSNH